MPQGNAGVTYGGATAGSNPMHNLAGERDKETDIGQITLKCDQDHFWVMAHRDLVKKYQGGDTSIAIMDMIEVVEVFHGKTKGEPQRPSSSMLKDSFGTDNTMDVIEKILKSGEFQ